MDIRDQRKGHRPTLTQPAAPPAHPCNSATQRAAHQSPTSYVGTKGVIPSDQRATKDSIVMAKTTTSTTTSAGKTPAPKASAKSPATAKPAAVAKGAAAKSADKAPLKAAAPTTITLRQLSAALAERHDMPKRQADTILADVFGSVVAHLTAGERVRIGGLGIIEVKNRAARMGRNPATGEAIQIKASKKIAFRPAKELKDAI